VPRRPQPRISAQDLARLRVFKILPNLTKIPLFVGLMVALTWLAWDTASTPLIWTAYVALGYLWMSIVTFMHDATHNTLFANRTLSWAFGITAMIPIFASFIAFKEDHLEHHRFNRSPRDPDAFTMGKRGPLDFLLFYAYMAIGAVLSFVHFNLLYPIQRFDRRKWAIHLGECALKARNTTAHPGIAGRWQGPVRWFRIACMRFSGTTSIGTSGIMFIRGCRGTTWWNCTICWLRKSARAVRWWIKVMLAFATRRWSVGRRPGRGWRGRWRRVRWLRGVRFLCRRYGALVGCRLERRDFLYDLVNSKVLANPRASRTQNNQKTINIL